MKAAKNLGLNIERVPSLSGGGIKENAEILTQWIRNQKEEVIWLLTMSRGSLDFRYAHQHLLNKEDLRRIRFWLNFTGFPHGNILAEVSFQNLNARLKTWLICKATGLSFEGVNEMRRGHPFWQNKFEVDSQIKVFNFVPIPLPSHIQTSLAGRYQRLSCYGPNDGMAICPDAIYGQSPTYPLFGLDHFCRSPQVVPLVYRILSYTKKIERTMIHKQSRPLVV